MLASTFVVAGVIVAFVVGLLMYLPKMLGIHYIPHNKVGVVEKLWSRKGSLVDGQILAMDGEAGYQAKVLRGGLHFGLFPIQYRIHLEPLVVVGEGRIGYVYSRDGESLSPVQALGRLVESNNFQDASIFLKTGGQRGRQRAILREGVYAINLAAFVVITETQIFNGPIREKDIDKYVQWQSDLYELDAFRPVLVGQGGEVLAEGAEIDVGERMKLLHNDVIGIITVHDGPPLESGEIIAPEAKAEDDDDGHHCFQDPERFLELGGRRGKQLQVLTEGTFFINRWFATVETSRKTMIPIGYVGVVVSFYGVKGEDVTGEGFRYGEQVERGHRGVWKHALPPGKYPLNPYAVTVELVPTTNIVLRWITGRTESHNYDKGLASIELITADGYEPTLPLSLVLHIDYENAPRVVQRFGNVHRLITQTLDPILSAYFRDVAQDMHMLDLLTKREEIQAHGTSELGRRFAEYDISCIGVLIGRPESQGDQYEHETDPIEQLFDQLRVRRSAQEQLLTYAKQEEAAMQLKALNAAKAEADRQTELTQSKIAVEISGHKGAAKLAEARRLAESDVVRADGSAQAMERMGRAEGLALELKGKGQASSVGAVGRAEAEVSAKKVAAYGDPRLYALQGVTDKLANSTQPLVPERVMTLGGGGGSEDGAGLSNAHGLFNELIALLIAEKGGFEMQANQQTQDQVAQDEVTDLDPVSVTVSDTVESKK